MNVKYCYTSHKSTSMFTVINIKKCIYFVRSQNSYLFSRCFIVEYKTFKTNVSLVTLLVFRKIEKH